jgi:hypothetical protein
MEGRFPQVITTKSTDVHLYVSFRSGYATLLNVCGRWRRSSKPAYHAIRQLGRHCLRTRLSRTHSGVQNSLLCFARCVYVAIHSSTCITLHMLIFILLLDGRQLPILTCYIASLPTSFPFRISIHLWTGKAKPSAVIESRKKPSQRVVYTAQVIVDGVRVLCVLANLSNMALITTY